MADGEPLQEIEGSQYQDTAEDIAELTKNMDRLETSFSASQTEQSVQDQKVQELMMLSQKRRAELEAKRVARDKQLANSKEQAAIKKQLQEQKKLEYKQRRDAIFEQHRLKKKAAEEAERGEGMPLIDSKHSSGGSANNIASASCASSTATTLRGPRSMRSSQSSHHVSAWTLYTGPKLFAKPTTKSNLILIQNALLKALEGAANAKTLKRMQDSIATHSKSCDHFLILFRSRHQFRGLYKYDDKQNTISKLDGIGPKSVNNEDILKYYKFDSPKRQFTEVQTRQICLTIIAFTIQDHLWSKTLSSKIPSYDLVHNQRNGHQ